jgi:hypothetical protein
LAGGSPKGGGAARWRRWFMTLWSGPRGG